MLRETLPALEPVEDPTPADPLADLLFTLIAAVLPAILLLAPTLHRTPPRPASAAAEPQVTVQGRRAAVIVAGATGLRLGGPEAATVLPDAIPASPDLARRLEALRSAGTPLVLLVEPDGLESAFLFDPVAATHGPARYSLVRSSEPCATTRSDTFKIACGTAREP